MTINEFVRKAGIRAIALWTSSNPHTSAMPRNFHCTLVRPAVARQMTLYYSQGSAHKDPPSAEDILACLRMDVQGADAGSFEEWAQELGYDEDFRKAEKIYRAVRDQTAQLRNFLGEDLFNELMNIEEGEA